MLHHFYYNERDFSTSQQQAGLDAAGKTTILFKLKLGTTVNATPTVGMWQCHSVPLSSDMVLYLAGRFQR
jgi:hypothetical protein